MSKSLNSKGCVSYGGTISSKPAYVCEKVLAGYLSMSVQWLRKKRDQGSGPPYCRLGRSIRYKVSDVHDYLKSCNIDQKLGS
jgi:hypothetical protein